MKSDQPARKLTKRNVPPPVVQLVGDIDHPDFRDAVQLLRADGRVVDSTGPSGELIVIAQSRPGTISVRTVEKLRRTSPLAGVIALAGTWCEGETRTGRPLPGVARLYWYEFPSWWRRQLALRAAGRCPGWVSSDVSWLSEPGCSEVAGATRPRPRSGIVAIRTSVRETANALADTCRQAGYATIWQSIYRAASSVHGMSAGIWVGGQLSDDEVIDLSKFSRSLADNNDGVIALLDFPRRDSVDRALEAGAQTVLGMPWHNAHLIETIAAISGLRQLSRAA